MRQRPSTALYSTFAAALWLLLSGCFDPDLSSDIPCASGDEPCPRAMECIDGFCRSGGNFDAAPKADGEDIPDAAYLVDAASSIDGARPPPADAAFATPCDPLTHEECTGAATRCAFIASSDERPYDGYFGCVVPVGNQQLGEACDYVLPGGGGFYDDCRTGLLCGEEFACQRTCELGQDDACDSEPFHCEPPLMIEPDVSPLGLCVLDP